MPAARRGGGPQRTYDARLCCGIVLTYEAPTFVPEVGEVVACCRHGWCAVESRDRGDGRAGGGTRRVMHRRSQSELITFLRGRPVTTVHALRREHFTLRVITAAQHDGLVDVDLATGRVALSARNHRRTPQTTAVVVDGNPVR
jgi:hypothetical protein